MQYIRILDLWYEVAYGRVLSSPTTRLNWRSSGPKTVSVVIIVSFEVQDGEWFIYNKRRK